MFACRVLVGYYARGAARFNHPPAKNAEGSLYDSCVDDPRHPSVFVVFDRYQIYPEFLITYEENSTFEVERSGVSACVSFAQVNVKETSQTSRATEPEQTSVITNWASCTNSLRITPTTGSASSLKGPDSDPEHTSSSGRGTDSLITVLGSTLGTTVGVTTALPVSAEHISNALPVSAQNAPTALPVSAEHISTTLPVLAKSISTALPVSVQNASPVLPVSAQNVPTALPVSAERISTAFPVSDGPGMPLTAQSSVCQQHLGDFEDSQATAVKYSVRTEDLSVTSLPVEVNRAAQSVSRSSGSMSSSSTLSSLPHDHTGNSPGGTNPHKPAAENKCVVM